VNVFNTMETWEHEPIAGGFRIATFGCGSGKKHSIAHALNTVAHARQLPTIRPTAISDISMHKPNVRLAPLQPSVQWKAITNARTHNEHNVEQ
jgi:uncharacterized protein (DUF2237 family)